MTESQDITPDRRSGHWCKIARVSRGMSLADDICYVCGARFGDNPPLAGEWVWDD